MSYGGGWVLVTLAASGAQTLRNAMQRDLIGALGAVGAAQVRFLFGLPFAVVFLAVMLAATGLALPSLSLANLGWTAFGAGSQVIATAMMLAAMRTRTFVVTIAYTKTEPAQIAIFGLVALGDVPTAPLVLAIALATVGVVMMSVRSRADLASDWRSALLGLFSATFFAFAAIGFRAAVIGVATSSRPLAASPHSRRGPRDPVRDPDGLACAVRPGGRRRHSRGLALFHVCGLHGRSRFAILVHRLRAYRRSARADARAHRGAACPGGVAQDVS